MEEWGWTNGPVARSTGGGGKGIGGGGDGVRDQLDREQEKEEAPAVKRIADKVTG